MDCVHVFKVIVINKTDNTELDVFHVIADSELEALYLASISKRVVRLNVAVAYSVETSKMVKGIVEYHEFI